MKPARSYKDGEAFIEPLPASDRAGPRPRPDWGCPELGAPFFEISRHEQDMSQTSHPAHAYAALHIDHASNKVFAGVAGRQSDAQHTLGALLKKAGHKHEGNAEATTKTVEGIILNRHPIDFHAMSFGLIFGGEDAPANEPSGFIVADGPSAEERRHEIDALFAEAYGNEPAKKCRLQVLSGDDVNIDYTSLGEDEAHKTDHGIYALGRRWRQRHSEGH
ncbi:hypothetical protein E3E12_05710 [Formicincola oecophyllae]|uniref:Uncharacterized protein n=1 Tax=Formicincola oecophyllae TaxID=2558361 RepID=A0A4Y6UCC0_9PROT|nr:hypothetical protein [Formicincola oecophyllae]QDH13765.1 hypothetical protein E3E12_05710 [Formicincola oecophyllae]